MQRLWSAGAGVPLMILMAAAGHAQDVRVSSLARNIGTAADTIAAPALSSTFRMATERTLPAVVFIAAQHAPLAPSRAQLEQLPDQLREFFRGPEARRRDATGSGFVIDADGHILTNTHVVADATRLLVRLIDGREYSARIVGSDLATDLALIKIDAQPHEQLPVATVGDSDGLQVGDWVLALGNPLGLDFSVTAGIVSAKGRQITNAIESFIQTDAVINPGNSGGPLIDLAGRVVGVNSAIFGSDRFVGYGFAVPINLARRVIPDLREHGFLRRPRLGVEIRAVRAVDAEIYGLAEVRGVFISTVHPDGAAAAAGIRAGDIVVSLDSETVRDDAYFMTALAASRPGEQVVLTLLRGGRTQDVRVRLGEFDRPVRKPAPPATLEEPGLLIGFAVRDMTPADAERIRFQGTGAAVVTSVIEHSGAWDTQHIREGAIILAINGEAIQTAEHATRLAKSVRAGSAVSVVLFDRDVMGERVVNFRARP